MLKAHYTFYKMQHSENSLQPWLFVQFIVLFLYISLLLLLFIFYSHTFPVLYQFLLLYQMFMGSETLCILVVLHFNSLNLSQTLEVTFLLIPDDRTDVT